jgi:hypothetical protein
MKVYKLYYFILFYILSLPLFFCNFSISREGCERFKNGKFIFHYKGLDGNTDILIDRNDSIQTEITKSTGDFTKSSVKWTDKYRFELTLLESTFSPLDSIKKIGKIIPLKAEILSCTNDYYLVKISMDNIDREEIDTMWINK